MPGYAERAKADFWGAHWGTKHQMDRYGECRKTNRCCMHVVFVFYCDGCTYIVSKSGAAVVRCSACTMQEVGSVNRFLLLVLSLRFYIVGFLAHTCLAQLRIMRQWYTCHDHALPLPCTDHLFCLWITPEGKRRRVDVIVVPHTHWPWALMGWTGSRQVRAIAG